MNKGIIVYDNVVTTFGCTSRYDFLRPPEAELRRQSSYKTLNPCGLDYFLKGGMIQECNSHNAIIISHCVYTRAARPARGDAH